MALKIFFLVIMTFVLAETQEKGTSQDVDVKNQVLENCEIGRYPPPQNGFIETEIVNLDLPPRERWRDVVVKRKTQILNFINYVKRLIPFGMFKYVADVLATGIDKVPAPYNEEIIGIADLLEAPLGDVLACNIFYELEKLCTSIVVQDQEGHIFHARNMDLGAWLGNHTQEVSPLQLWRFTGKGCYLKTLTSKFSWDSKNNTWEIAELLHPLTVNVEFQQNGDVLFKSVQFAGTVGVFTGLKPDKFSISLNSRSPKHAFGGPMGIIAWLLTPRPDDAFASLWARAVLEKAENYDEAKEMLSTKPLLAPVYFILAGMEPYEGTVITRTTKDSIHQMNLDSNHWFVLQTNYDNWKTPPFYDDRRKPAVICLNEFGRPTNTTPGMLFDILSTEPIKNKATIYTALMSPRGGYLESYRRKCKGTCYPW